MKQNTRASRVPLYIQFACVEKGFSRPDFAAIAQASGCSVTSVFNALAGYRSVTPELAARIYGTLGLEAPESERAA